MSNLCRFAAVALSLGLAAHANAQAASTPASPAPSATEIPAVGPTSVGPLIGSAPAPAAELAVPKDVCELHVFPTLEGQAITTGWLVGFGIVGALADAAANKDRNISEAEYLKSALGPEFQVSALKSIDLVKALKLPEGTSVLYETPISDRGITTQAKTRLSSSTAPCYAELIVTQNLYRKAAIYGRSLNNRFVYKDFRDAKTEAKLVKGRGGNGLSAFPPQTTADRPAAEDDLRNAFAKNFLEYSKNF